MNTFEQQRFDYLYEQHLTNLTLQGKRPATIDAYSRAVRQIAAFFDCCPDNLTTDDLKRYFAPLEKISQARATRPCPCCHKPMKFIQVHTRLTNFIMQQTRQPNATV